jgi:hypothetical protein
MDFVDAQFRATYDWSRHRFGITGILGRSEIDQSSARDRLDLNDILKSRSDIQLGSLFWNYGSGPPFESSTRVFAVNGDFINENRDVVTLAEGRRSIWAFVRTSRFSFIPSIEWSPASTFDLGKVEVSKGTSF